MEKIQGYEPRQEFIERIKLLLNNEEDLKSFFEFAKTKPKKSFRVNTLKISPEELLKKLPVNWKLNQLKDYPEIIIIDSILKPGELGKTKEHILGEYYIQETTSMMPLIALNPNKEDIFLDLCASPGSKTTQAAALMENKGTIIANELSSSRLPILCANLERCGVSNAIVTRHDGIALCSRLKKLNFYFDKILVDAPCSGEGNIRLSPKTYLEWSEPLLDRLSRVQKNLASSALEILKVNGEMVYSTCTHSPEENECVVEHLLNNFDIELLDFGLPIKTRPGINEWNNQKFHKDMHKCKRIYHHDNDMEGFFVCLIKKLSDKKMQRS
ncbi:MAG: NOL1/NOP2/sun family putative RNA methylase [Candidatus Nanoarchaeia archaeon]